MKKKGFTLIELLAVIVILAVIALIATPAVLNIIEDSKRSSAEDSARIIAKEAETYYVSETTLEGKEVGDIDLTGDTLKYKGDKPSKGYVTFDNKGNAYLKMYMNGYCVESDYDNTVESEKTEENDCRLGAIIIPLDPNGGTLDVTTLVAKEGSPLGELPIPTREDYIFGGWFTEGGVLVDENTIARENLTLTAQWTKSILTVTLDDNRPFVNGEVVYFNPITNSACLDTEYNATTNSTNGFRGTEENGCLKWRAFLDVNNTATVKLLLDHNTSATDVPFANVMTEIGNIQDNNTYGWHEEVYPSVRLITAEEVYKMAPYNGGTWTTTDGTAYNLHTGTQTSFTRDRGTNKYGWLFDNLDGCYWYGCNVEQGSSDKYYTSTRRGTTKAYWAISYDGRHSVEYTAAAIRPVVEVSRAALSPKMEVAYGGTYGEIPTPIREGYTFTGWRTTGGAEVTSDTIYQLTTDTTIYAQWQANTYTVTFKSDDEIVETRTVTYNQPYGTLPPDQVKDGYLFKGWKKNEYTAIDAQTLVTTASNHDIEAILVEKTYLEKLYFNPVTNEACREIDYNATTNSKTGFRGTTSNGCMLWYAYKEDGDNYLMILDHSTSSTWLVWEAATTEITNVRDNNLYGWHAEVYPTARFITAEEVNELAPYKYYGTWTLTSDNWYYLHTGEKPEYKAGIIGINKYAWLFDNTINCDSSGCNIPEIDNGLVVGYWTSSVKNEEKVWHVSSVGRLDYCSKTSYETVRPVISVPKSKFTN